MSSGRDIGKAWQAQLGAWHYTYRDRLWIKETGAPIVMLSSPRAGGVFRARFCGEGPPDYLGCYMGRALTAEAKATKRDKTRLLFTAIESHQAHDLESISRSGGIALLLVRCGGRCLVGQWSDLSDDYWNWRKKKSRKASLSNDDPRWAPMDNNGWLTPALERGWL